jgi:hypothetical protein
MALVVVATGIPSLSNKGKARQATSLETKPPSNINGRCAILTRPAILEMSSSVGNIVISELRAPFSS